MFGEKINYKKSNYASSSCSKIDGKDPLDITIGVFFDGTLNNRGVKIIS